ncbi:Nucleic acid-binding, OB-fold-like protein [Prunus dulcis]|uniref:Nucleic acid-binding, OB-fold-like protein n=1 Tax=Prunus dulcis TaxID=3755 RepID=A0A4Y1R5T9_PRUDU|nr:Nucleic acid-binding, OB-fold-like protein [Prunus dulcis]
MVVVVLDLTPKKKKVSPFLLFFVVVKRLFYCFD